MKIILIISILSCVKLSAQLNIAVTGGLNYSNVNSILFGKNYYNELNKYYKYQAFGNLGIEMTFMNKRFSYGAGLIYSYRGTRDYYVPLIFFRNGYAIDMSGYLELPLKINYNYFKQIFDSGIDVILHKRVYDGVSYYNERNKLYGLDVRISSSWNINRYLAIVPSYTFGNLDKYIANTYGNFLHHVFALNLRYTFMHLNKK
ncbi:MAG: hypothetical protein ABI851_12960 [Saprospiraceae bacterium]